MLSKEELEIRMGFANASEAGIITGEDPQAKLNLYNEKIGLKEPDDLRFVQPVRFGEVTEDLNIEFFENKMGATVINRQLTVVSDEYPWMRATLDGMVREGDAVVECKCVSAFAKKDEQSIKYYPQVQQQMLITGARRAYLSVFFGTLVHEIFTIDADPIFQSQLADATRRFMECVKTKTPPVEFTSVHVPIEPINRVDMSGSNEWGSSAAVWLANSGYARTYDDAAKKLKELTPADAVEAFGAGVRISRSKTGSLTIRREK